MPRPPIQNFIPPVLPRRLRQPRLLLVGCGDVAARIACLLAGRYRIRALLRHAPDSVEAAHWRQLGATPVQADLDDARSLHRLRGIAERVIYLAPPASLADSLTALRPAQGERVVRAFPNEPRLKHLLAALHDTPLHSFVLVSTSGVYGDQGGARIDETCPLHPQTPRGQRRVAAEQTLRRWQRQRCRSDLHPSTQGGILRAPGIYAADRLPLARLRNGTPALIATDDCWTNHIHADDLARMCWLALYRLHSLRAINASDSSQLKMADWFNAVADATGLPRPPRLPRAALRAAVSPVLYSFMSESRRLDNRRLREELRARLIYPTVGDFLDTLPPATKAIPC